MQKTIKNIRRLRNSHYGNPAFELTFEGGDKLRTKPNISDAYAIHGGMVGQSVKIETETTRAGRVYIVGIN